MKTIIAIDPGASGGIAVRYGDGTVDARKVPDTPKDTYDFLAAIQAGALDCGVRAYMEEVSGYAGNSHPGSFMFRFGQTYGNLEGFLIALGIPFELVRPQKWMKALGIPPIGIQRGDYKGLSAEDAAKKRKHITQTNNRLKAAHKNRLKERAQRLFPQIKVTLANADALLLLEYGCKQENIPIATPANQSGH